MHLHQNNFDACIKTLMHCASKFWCIHQNLFRCMHQIFGAVCIKDSMHASKFISMHASKVWCTRIEMFDACIEKYLGVKTSTAKKFNNPALTSKVQR